MYIPHMKVREFVNTVQRDPKLNEILHPYQNEDQALELVQIYEPNAMFGQKGKNSTYFCLNTYLVIMKCRRTFTLLMYCDYVIFFCFAISWNFDSKFE